LLKVNILTRPTPLEEFGQPTTINVPSSLKLTLAPHLSLEIPLIDDPQDTNDLEKIFATQKSVAIKQKSLACIASSTKTRAHLLLKFWFFPG
jgi:hypothetical protein